MAKSFIDKRAVFTSGRQQAFLESIRLKLSDTDAARLCGYSERTVRTWREEKSSMPLAAVHALVKRTHVLIPNDFHIQDKYAHASRAGKMGNVAVTALYGGIPRDESYRKERWREWWRKEGKNQTNPILQSKPIKKPKKSATLAEFIGIVMGDGGISRYQVVITLHHVDDLEYSVFVAHLIKRLFGISPAVYHSVKNSVNDVTVSRVELVKYLHELGLPIGNKIKQGLDIPSWIIENPTFAIACVRGLVDTDGSVFTHRYKSKGTWYTYKKLSFTSMSPSLRESVYTILLKLKLHPRKTGPDIRLDSIADMRRYFKLVGTHNPKHLKRYRSEVG